MLTLGTSWNLAAEAVLAKSLLDDYEIFCAVFHENANLYGGAPAAMPVRLVVADDQADLAVRILRGDMEIPGEDERPASIIAVQAAVQENNPWELLVLAFYFLLPGWCVLHIQYPVTEFVGRRVDYEMAAVRVIHLIGWIAIIFAVWLIGSYLRARRNQVEAERGPNISS